MHVLRSRVNSGRIRKRRVPTCRRISCRLFDDHFDNGLYLLPHNHHVHHRSTLHPARCWYRLVAKGVFPILIAAPAMRPLPMVARRWATTQSLTPKENVALLNAQRLQRPNSPHFTIYQPQVSSMCLAWTALSLPRSLVILARLTPGHMASLDCEPSHGQRPLRPDVRCVDDLPPSPRRPRHRLRTLD